MAKVKRCFSCGRFLPKLRGGTDPAGRLTFTSGSHTCPKRIKPCMSPSEYYKVYKQWEQNKLRI